MKLSLVLVSMGQLEVLARVLCVCVPWGGGRTYKLFDGPPVLLQQGHVE